MLLLTPAAGVEIVAARKAQGLPDSVGLRVFGEPRPGGEMELALTFVALPAEDDEVSEQEGTKLFVAPEVAAPLASAALDVEETPQGTRLVVTQQEDGGDI